MFYLRTDGNRSKHRNYFRLSSMRSFVQVESLLLMSQCAEFAPWACGLELWRIMAPHASAPFFWHRICVISVRFLKSDDLDLFKKKMYIWRIVIPIMGFLRRFILELGAHRDRQTDTS